MLRRKRLRKCRPRPSHESRSDWAAAQAALAGFAQLTAPDQAAGAAAGDALARLNAVTEKIFPKIAASSVPVLLPFDTAAFLRDAAAGETGGGRQVPCRLPSS